MKCFLLRQYAPNQNLNGISTATCFAITNKNEGGFMTEKEAFDATMKKVLSVSKAELQKRLKAEKKRKSASSRVPAASRQNAVSST
jgi:hypothetical protein